MSFPLHSLQFAAVELWRGARIRMIYFINTVHGHDYLIIRSYTLLGMLKFYIVRCLITINVSLLNATYQRQ